MPKIKGAKKFNRSKCQNSANQNNGCHSASTAYYVSSWCLNILVKLELKF